MSCCQAISATWVRQHKHKMGGECCIQHLDRAAHEGEQAACLESIQFHWCPFCEQTLFTSDVMARLRSPLPTTHYAGCDRPPSFKSERNTSETIQTSRPAHTAPQPSPPHPITGGCAGPQNNQSINVTSVAMKFIKNSCQPFTENHLFG
jgi:hypothetical protein